MLELYGLKQCRPALATGTDALRKQLDCGPLDPEDHKRYRRAVGQLLWLSSVRPDIMYAVKELSRGLSAPTTEHEAKVKHLCRNQTLFAETATYTFTFPTAQSNRCQHLC